MTLPLEALREKLEKFMTVLSPIEKSAVWARDHAARAPSSHQEFVRQADEDWGAYETAKEALLSVLVSRAEEEMVPHEFDARIPGEEDNDGHIWCSSCEYHRDHEIHTAPSSPPQDETPQGDPPSRIIDAALIRLVQEAKSCL